MISEIILKGKGSHELTQLQSVTYREYRPVSARGRQLLAEIINQLQRKLKETL